MTGPDERVTVDGTDVLLEQIVTDFEGGSGADEIAAKYPGLRLSDVFLVLSFYLKYRKDVEDYLARQIEQGPRTHPVNAA